MKDLVQIIKDNPGCIAEIDNDSWHLFPARSKPKEDMTEEDHEDYYDKPLACNSDIEPLGDDGYGHCDGGDILQALAEIVGIKVERV
ncbi:hypothetical protein MNBD_GAMMA01-1317 [hydrothermal vent metagenome]|uniref:Uncharacterized protein n=1 Tax=hydrothermal vent metagenome TaxID=652676 RepID=A0A3B0VKN9_9ZZZZ